MSTADRSTDLSVRPMTFDEYLSALRCVGYGQSLDERQERIMRAVPWGDITPCYMAWDGLREALMFAEKAAQIRWRHARRIQVEEGAGNCTIYRVSTWAKRMPTLSADDGQESESAVPSPSGFCMEAMYEEPMPGEQWTETTGFGRIEDMHQCLGYDVVASQLARAIIDGSKNGQGAHQVLTLVERVGLETVAAHSNREETNRARHLLRSASLTAQGLVPVLDDRLSPIERQLRREIEVGFRRSALEALAGVVAVFALDNLGRYPDSCASGDLFAKHVRAFVRTLLPLRGFSAVREFVASLEELLPSAPRASAPSTRTRTSGVKRARRGRDACKG